MMLFGALPAQGDGGVGIGDVQRVIELETLVTGEGGRRVARP